MHSLPSLGKGSWGTSWSTSLAASLAAFLLAPIVAPAGDFSSSDHATLTLAAAETRPAQTQPQETDAARPDVEVDANDEPKYLAAAAPGPHIHGVFDCP